MENTLISISADVAVIVSASVATIALALSAFALREVRNSQQFNIINSVLNDIHQIDSEVINLLTVYEDKKNIQLTRDSMK